MGLIFHFLHWFWTYHPSRPLEAGLVRQKHSVYPPVVLPVSVLLSFGSSVSVCTLLNRSRSLANSLVLETFPHLRMRRHWQSSYQGGMTRVGHTKTLSSRLHEGNSYWLHLCALDCLCCLGSILSDPPCMWRQYWCCSFEQWLFCPLCKASLVWKKTFGNLWLVEITCFCAKLKCLFMNL